jgi:hypothetical protein
MVQTMNNPGDFMKRKCWKKKCKTEGCDKKEYSRGYCWKHLVLSGEPRPGRLEPLPLAARFYRLVGPVRLDGCQIWNGRLDTSGYGKIRYGGRDIAAHRAAYELVNGSIPEGFHIHHICHCKFCVNPDHLVAITPQEHIELHRQDIIAMHERAKKVKSMARSLINLKPDRRIKLTRKRKARILGIYETRKSEIAKAAVS